MLPRMTSRDIWDQHPTYHPETYLPDKWAGTALDILNITSMPARTRLWVVFRPEWIGAETIHCFLIWAIGEANDQLPHPSEEARQYLKRITYYPPGPANDHQRLLWRHELHGKIEQMEEARFEATIDNAEVDANLRIHLFQVIAHMLGPLLGQYPYVLLEHIIGIQTTASLYKSPDSLEFTRCNHLTMTDKYAARLKTVLEILERKP